MLKIKKLLAVLLAIIMLASFTPMFALAADPIALTESNVTVWPTAEGSIYFGQKISDGITLSGGEVQYNGTVVAGHFEFIDPSLVPTYSGAQRANMKFIPDDETTYTGFEKNRSRDVLFDVLKTTLVFVDKNDTVPVATAVYPGAELRTSTLTGAKVKNPYNETEPHALAGVWKWRDGFAIVNESGYYEAIMSTTSGTGYEELTVQVYVDVIGDAVSTEIAEAPTMTGIEIGGSNNQRISNSAITGGKVVDESGAEITGGTWTVTGYPEGITASSYVFADTTVTLTWTKQGYKSVTTQAVIPVTQVHETYTFEAFPSLELSGQRLSYSPDLTWESLKINPGIIKDKNGNIVEGTYELYTNNSGTNKRTGVIIPNTSASAAYIFFVPNDSTLPTFGGIYDYIFVSKTSFTLTEDSELVFNYGTGHKMPFYGSDFKYSTLKTEPADAGVYKIIWEKDVFDPATADYGSVTKVRVTVYPEKTSSYNNITFEIPIRIQKFTYSDEGWFGSKSNFVFTGTKEQGYDGIKEYKIDFTNTSLKGTVDLIVNDEVVASASPDENGRFYAEGQWVAPESGDYTYRFEYKPSEEDAAIVNKPVAKESTITIELRPMRTLTIKVGDEVYTYTERVGTPVYFDWRRETGLSVEDFSSWSFTDAQGNTVAPVNPDGEDITKESSIYIFMPDYDVIATERSAASSGDIGDSSGLGSLWSFWQKLVDWIVSIYRMIIDFLVPTVETF